MIRTLMYVLCLLLSVQAFAMDLTLSEDEGFDYLIANDAIMSEKDSKNFEKILSAQVKKGAPTSILLTSPGGALEIAEDIADIIIGQSNALFKKWGRYNLLIINEECSSACAVMLASITMQRNPQALRIFVTPNANFGFHAPQELKKGKVKPYTDKKKRAEKIKTQIEALTEHGVSEEWLKKNRGLFEKDSMTNVKAGDLCAAKAGIVPADSCTETPDEDVTVLTERHTCHDGRPPMKEPDIPVAMPDLSE